MPDDAQARVDLEAEVQDLVERLALVGKRLAELEDRLTRLEVREEVLENPMAAGDEPVGGLV